MSSLLSNKCKLKCQQNRFLETNFEFAYFSFFLIHLKFKRYHDDTYVAVNFLFQLIFVFPLFMGMVMYANEFETKEKQKLTEIKNKLQHIHSCSSLVVQLNQGTVQGGRRRS